MTTKDKANEKGSQSNITDPQPPSTAEQAVQPPPPASADELKLTHAELQALVDAAVTKATEPLNERIKKAEALTSDEKALGILKEAYKTGYKMPDEVAEIAAGIVDPEKRDKFIAHWNEGRATPASDALASAQEKVARARKASEENIPPMGGGGAGGKAPPQLNDLLAKDMRRMTPSEATAHKKALDDALASARQ